MAHLEALFEALVFDIQFSDFLCDLRLRLSRLSFGHRAEFELLRRGKLELKDKTYPLL
jgi:hypothetical protein